MTRARRLTLIDLMAVTGGAAFGMTAIGTLAPGRLDLAIILVGPLLGTLIHRRIGGRGILGGTLGGAAYAGLVLLDFFTGPHGPGRPGPSTMAHWQGQVIVMTSICLAFGAGTGASTWLLAATMGIPRNDPRRLQAIDARIRWARAGAEPRSSRTIPSDPR